MSKVILKTENITKRYGKNLVLDNINMTINEGDIYGFIGRNGAGKTTFMRVILNLTNRDGGKVELFENAENARLKIGSLIEDPGLYKNFTAYENMKRFAIINNVNDDNKLKELLKIVGLSNVGKKKVKNFSLGMRQRLGIAISLLGDPEFLVLDEPINGLDPAGIKDIRDLILKLNKEKNITFLISSHILDELAKVVTKYGIINNGVLVEEITSKELEDKCKHKLIIDVDRLSDAVRIISKIVPEEDIVMNKHNIEVNSHIEDAAKINKLLVKNDIEVRAIYPNNDSIEEYFMERIGN